MFELVHVYLQTHITCTDMKCSIYIQFYTQKRKLSEELRTSLDCNDRICEKEIEIICRLTM